MTEAQLRREIKEAIAAQPLLRVFQLRDRELRGWPDLVIVGACGILVRELKSRTGVLSPQQRWTGNRMLGAGWDWAIWRPADWHSGLIEEQLRAAWQLVGR
jgi:hypothetical protein